MINVQAVVLKQLLTSEDTLELNKAFLRLKKQYFSNAFSSIYIAIQTYYAEHGSIPKLETLQLLYNRNVKLSQALSVLELQKVPEVSIDHSISVLENEVAQDYALDLIEDNILKDLPELDRDSIIDRLISLGSKAETDLGQSSRITMAKDIAIFRDKGDEELPVTLGLSNSFEEYSGSLRRTEVLLIGGYVGSGKSVICSNLQVMQHSLGKVAPYYSLEMRAVEVLMRNLSIMAGISASELRNNKLSSEAVKKLLRTRAGMFHGGVDLFKEYINKYTINEMSDGFELESRLMEEYEEVTAMPIIYDPSLTVERIEANTRSLINSFGEDKVELQIVDYLQQVRLDGSNNLEMYDWQPQMVVAKELKSMSGRLNVASASPYQMDAAGNVRMSKGILDSCDIAIILNPARKEDGKGGVDPEGAIGFETRKCRSMSGMEFITGIDWRTLKLQPSQNYTKGELLARGIEFSLDLDGNSSGKKKSNKKANTNQDDNKRGSIPPGATDI